MICKYDEQVNQENRMNKSHMRSTMYICIEHEPRASSISTASKQRQQMGRIYQYSDIFLQEEVDLHRSN